MTQAGWSVRAARERSHTDRHRALLDAAARVFAERGYDRTTVADITAAAGVSRATLYVYFASKDEIFLALAAQVRDDFLAAQEPDLDTDDPQEVLAATIDAFAAAVRNAGPMLRLIDERGAVDDRVAALAQEIAERPVRRFTRYLERLRTAGRISPAVPTRIVAETIGYALIRGTLTRMDATPRARATYLAHIRTVAETLLSPT
ncbi:TetR/AcrR family transcriptional regulator [Nocardia sp. CA-119907]|uniref:TetR/AcrR family transcriptional regulator n=1 Tax=Nocardia sp. CA-119907 TaxID=3239973 RepID=UPI003D96883D